MRIVETAPLMAGLLLLGALALTVGTPAARADAQYVSVPGTLISAVGQWVQGRGPVMLDAKTAYVPCRLISVGIKPGEAAAPATDGMARVAFKAVNADTGEPTATGEVEFELNFTFKEDKWSYVQASQVAVAEGKETLTAAPFMNPPPPPPKLGVLPGEEGKPVQTTKTGMKYVVLEEGTGAKPKKGDKVTAEYTGWLADGTQFDTSKDHGGTFELAVGEGQVIPGWDEALLDMKVGERRKLVIPPELAYGAQGTPGGPIPPNATLTFEVKLVKVN